MSNETPTFLEGKANYFTEFGGIDNNIIFSDDDEIRGLYLWKVFDRMMQDNPRQRAFVLYDRLPERQNSRCVRPQNQRGDDFAETPLQPRLLEHSERNDGDYAHHRLAD